MKIIRPLALICLQAMPMLIHAALSTWQMIPEQSHLTFLATQNGAPVKGEFKHFTATISFDTSDLEHSQATIVIDITSVSTSYNELSTTLLTPDWFNATLFPKAEFKTTAITKTGNNTYQALGSLRLRDKVAPVTLTFSTTDPSIIPVSVEGNTHFNRSTFGVGQGEWSSTNEIKDEVTVHFKLVATDK